MDRTPLQTLTIQLLRILLKRANHPNIILECRSDFFDIVDHLLVFDVAFEEGVDEFEQAHVHHELQAVMVLLEVFEDVEGHAHELVAGDLLEDFADLADYAEFWDGEVGGVGLLQEGD